MKTQYSKWSWKHWPTFTATIALFALVLVTAIGCGKKSRVETNPDYRYGNGPYGNCPNCPAGSQFLLSALGVNISGYSGQPRMELSLELYGAGSSSYGQTQYSGQVSATGRLTVFMNDNSACPIPAGTYNLTTTTAGTMQGQSIYDLELVGNNGIRVAVTNAFVSATTAGNYDASGRSYPYRLQNQVYVMSQYSGQWCDFIFE